MNLTKDQARELLTVYAVALVAHAGCSPVDVRDVLAELVGNDEFWRAVPHMRAAFERAGASVLVELQQAADAEQRKRGQA